jgi:hypothetical protein
MRPTTQALLAAAVLTASARGQFAQQPSPSLQAPNPNSQAVARPNILDQPVTPQIPPQFGYGAAPVYGAPYGGYGYGGNRGGFLNGVANVTSAQSQALVTQQAARQASFQADAAQLDYRRRVFDEMNYEKMHTPTPEDIRAREQEMALRRARNDPPQTEIWDGTALNTLFQNIRQTQAVTGAFGPSVPINPAWLPHLAVTAGVARSGGTMFTEKLKWPLPLAVSRYKDNRDQIAGLINDAVMQIKSAGMADPGTLENLSGAIKALQARTDKDIASMTPSDSIRCDRYLNELRNGVQVLAQPDAAKAVGGGWAARGNTVGELVTNMTRDGLKFAPANPGDEQYYTALYNSLLTYDAGLTHLVSR